jgi:hypothetical protein
VWKPIDRGGPVQAALIDGAAEVHAVCLARRQAKDRALETSGITLNFDLE